MINEIGWSQSWKTEIIFSTNKRTFGEYVSATRFQNMVKEMMINTTSLDEYSITRIRLIKG